MTRTRVGPPARKFLNRPEDVVPEYLVGLRAAHSDLLRIDPRWSTVISTSAARTGKVGLLSGGGSGCEPLHTGFVGPGMLDAACAGRVFSSPVPDQLLAAMAAVDGGAGVLAIVKNFSGEVMNFDMAVELASYDFPTMRVERVVVNDDIAVADSEDTAGRRGLGATVLVEKIAGAAADRGDDLDAVVRIARRVVDRSRTLGIGLSSCTRPNAGEPAFDLPRGEMEVGIGISGEPGRERSPLLPARDIADLLVEEILSDLAPAPAARMLALVNGLGGTPLQELYLLNGEIDRRLTRRGLRPERHLVGNLVTSLDQAGAALTLLELDDELIELWDRPVHTAALRWGR